MPGRPLAAALVAATVVVSPAQAQVADSHGEGLAVATSSRAAAVEPLFVPLSGPLESPFGYRWGRLHAGLDIGVLGTDRVHAALPGTVVRVGYQPHYAGYGNVVVIRYRPGFATLYAHLARYRVSPGDLVTRGEPIGRAGCTGSCTGQHLHFEVRIQGKPVNPMRFLKGRVRPSGAQFPG